MKARWLILRDPGWLDLFEDALSDVDLRDGQHEFGGFDVATKEELLYLRMLASKMDVKRVPHLRARLRLNFPCAA